MDQASYLSFHQDDRGQVLGTARARRRLDRFDMRRRLRKFLQPVDAIRPDGLDTSIPDQGGIQHLQARQPNHVSRPLSRHEGAKLSGADLGEERLLGKLGHDGKEGGSGGEGDDIVVGAAAVPPVPEEAGQHIFAAFSGC